MSEVVSQLEKKVTGHYLSAQTHIAQPISSAQSITMALARTLCALSSRTRCCFLVSDPSGWVLDVPAPAAPVGAVPFFSAPLLTDV